MMNTQPNINSAIRDLSQVDGCAELVDGKLVHMNPTGDLPGAAAGEIYFQLRLFLSENFVKGRAYPDNVGFIVDLPNRKSFSPDVAFYDGERTGMKFIEGTPKFAVEVRSENDYGNSAEKRIAAKRADYFAAGTEVVWDVDLLGEEVIKSFTRPDKSIAFGRNEFTLAEPAIADWKFDVEALFI